MDDTARTDKNAYSKLMSLLKPTASPLHRFFYSMVEKPVESTLSISKINRLYRQMVFDSVKENPFRIILAGLQVQYEISSENLSWIPARGSLVITANHPLGGIEGIILGQILMGIRPDVRILGNYLLQQIPELKEFIIPVNPFSPGRDARTNGVGLREAIRWVEKGGALITFPSGTVSHLQIRRGGIFDPPWNRHISGIVRLTQAAVLPVFIPGQNGILFQIAGLLHPMLRTMIHLIPIIFIFFCGTSTTGKSSGPIVWRRLIKPLNNWV